MKNFLLVLLLGLSSLLAGPFGNFNPTASSVKQTRKPWFKGGVKVGDLNNTYVEISGLTQSQKAVNNSYLWAIEDGANPHIIAINKATAAAAGKWSISGVSVTDVEEVDSATVSGQPYIFLFDTGDNASARSTFKVLRVKEPTVTGSNATFAGADVTEIVCEFPAANIPSLKDVEAAFADPFSGDLYFITKRITPILCYKLPFALTYTGTQSLTYMGALSNDATLNTTSTTPTGNNGYATGACISPNGTEILICNYLNVYRFSRNLQTQTIFQALQTTPTIVESVVGAGNGAKALATNSLPQQEAVCFDRNGLDYYTCSEYVTSHGGSSTNYPLFKFVRLEKSFTTYSFQDGVSSYAGTLDTYIDQTTPGTSQATATSIVADFDYSAYPTTSRIRNGLLKFDLSSIPTTSTVVAAYIDFDITAEGLGFSMFKMLASWTEASTYTSLTSGVSRNDVEASSVADVIMGPTPVGQGWDTYVGPCHCNLPTATVQDWVSNPSNNYGYAIFGPNESTGDGLQLATREAATVSTRPKLVIKTIP